MKLSGIYKIQSIIKSNRCYIGSAVDISDRWKVHLCLLRKGNHHSIKLQNHYNKYGETDFHFSILLNCEKEDLKKVEQYFINSYLPWFNINKNADNRLGTKQSEESKMKSSISNKGKHSEKKGPQSIKHRQNITKYASSRPIEHNYNISKGRIGIIPWNKGLTKETDERINKQSETQKKLIRTEEHCKNISKARMGIIPWNKGLKIKLCS